MSTREPHFAADDWGDHPDDAVMLARLGDVLLDESAGPTEADMRWLRAALDERFGPVVGLEVEVEVEVGFGAGVGAGGSGRVVVPLWRRPAAIVTGVAAALVLVALGLAWSSWRDEPTSSPATALARLHYATAALRHDLAQGSSPARLSGDVTQLAHVLTTVSAQERDAATAGAPGRLLAAACGALERGRVPAASGGADAAAPSVPAVCPVTNRRSGVAPSSGGGAGAPASHGPAVRTPGQLGGSASSSPGTPAPHEGGGYAGTGRSGSTTGTGPGRTGAGPTGIRGTDGTGETGGAGDAGGRGFGSSDEGGPGTPSPSNGQGPPPASTGGAVERYDIPTTATGCTAAACAAGPGLGATVDTGIAGAAGG